MLSKLTFSLASIILLLMVAICLPVSAQTTVNIPQPPDPDDTGDLVAGTIPAMGFLVVGNSTEANTGVTADSVNYVQIAANALPDLEEFFRFGGTVALTGPAAITDTSDPPVTLETFAAKDLVISEIMWALDVGPPAADETGCC